MHTRSEPGGARGRRRRRRRSGARRPLELLAIGLTVVASSSSAQANGRPPNTISVDINPHDPTQWVVGTTFGMALSSDCGATFRHVCENVVVNQDAPFESAQGFTGGDFRVVFGTGHEILVEGGPAARSTDGGLSWSPMQGLPRVEGGEATFGRLVGSTVANRAYLPYYDRQASYGEGQSGVSTAYRTEDGGASWRRLPGLALPGINLLAMAESPAEPSHLVAVGQAVNTFTGPWVSVSEDAGTSWSTPRLAAIAWLPPRPAADAPPPQLNQIFLARDHQDKGRLWLAGVVDTPAQPGVATLLGSTDTGHAFTQLAILPSAVRNLALADDRPAVWAALGDSDVKGNVYHAEDGVHFAPLPWPRTNACVTRLGKMTLLCGHAGSDGFSVGVSGDGGATVHRGMQLSQLVLRPFEAGSLAADRCEKSWPTYAQAIGANPAPGGPAPAPAAPQVALSGLCDGSLGPAALAASAPTAVGAPGSGSGGDGTAAGGAEGPASAPEGGGAPGRGRGCACQAHGRTGLEGLAAWAGAAALVARARRRGPYRASKAVATWACRVAGSDSPQAP